MKTKEEIKKLNMKKLTPHQKQIFKLLKEGGILKCTEGTNYKAWLEMPNYDIINVRKDTVDIILNFINTDMFNYKPEGITLNNHKYETYQLSYDI